MSKGHASTASPGADRLARRSIHAFALAFPTKTRKTLCANMRKDSGRLDVLINKPQSIRSSPRAMLIERQRDEDAQGELPRNISAFSRSREDHGPEQVRTNHQHRLDARPPSLRRCLGLYRVEGCGNCLLAHLRQGGCAPRDYLQYPGAGSYSDRPFGFSTRKILAGRTFSQRHAEMGNLTDVSNTIDWLVRPESHSGACQVI